MAKNKKMKENITNNLFMDNVSVDNIIVDFSGFPFCFRSVKCNDFTNFLKDNEEFSIKLKYIFERLLPHIIQFTFNDIYINTKRHSHEIKRDTKEYDLVCNIVKKLYKEFKPEVNDDDIELFFEQNVNDYRIWQLGISGGTRLVGIKTNNFFKLLFFDYHHLIYPDENYNQLNYEKYDYCPIKGGRIYEETK